MLDETRKSTEREQVVLSTAREGLLSVYENIKPSLKIALVTPQKAAAYLKQNKSNRRLDPNLVDQYAADMKVRKWDLNAETMKFTILGELIDGQHRLHACVKSGESFWCVIAYGLPPGAMKNVDRGKSRSFTDRLGLEYGDIHYTAQKAAVTRMLFDYYSDVQFSRVSDEQLMDTFRKYRKEISEATEKVYEWRQVAGNSSPMNLTSAIVGLILFSKKDREKAEAYVEQLVAGEEISRADVAYHVRNRIIKYKRDSARNPNARDQFIMVVKGWNALRAGRSLTKVFLRTKSNEEAESELVVWRQVKIK